MKELALATILDATGGEPVNPGGLNLSEPVREISTDSRTIGPGSLFIPLLGENFDGHGYIEEALKKGAVAALSSKECSPAHLPIIRVADTLKAYHAIAAAYRKMFSLPIIAITGSNGKTTTKDLMGEVLSRKYRVLKTAANFNNEIGVPKTLLELDHSTEVMVLEMAMRGPGQIRELAGMVQPDRGVITNIGEAHFELLGSYEAIANAKAELLECLPAKGTAILNHDDRWFSYLGQKSRAPVLSFGLDKGATLRLLSYEAKGVEGFSVKVRYLEEDYDFHLPFLGFHNVYNSMAAILVGFMLEVPAPLVQKGLEEARITGRRMEKIVTPDGITIINDTYNASPSSVEQAIRTLSLLEEKGRKVIVLGDMRELGDIAEESHRRVGRMVAEAAPDYLVTLGDSARWIYEGAREAGFGADRCFWFQDRGEAREKVNSLLSPRDVLLVKASRLMKFEEIAEYVIHKRSHLASR